MKIKLLIVGIAITSIFSSIANAQLTISSGAVFNIQGSAFVTVQGDVLSNADITGAGSLVLKGSANQNVNMNGFTIPNLEMDNTANATLTGNLKIGSSVKFTNGKVLLGSNTATLTTAALSTGMGTSKFFETDGTGFVRRELAADISNVVSPVGVGTDYLPVTLTNTGSTYAGASIGVQAKGIANANRHPRTETYLLANWPINKIGITAGSTNAVGTYVDPTRFVSFGSGVETDLRGFFWNGTNWSVAGGSQDAALNTVGASITGTSGELFGMNTFVLLDSKVFLQGAYNTVTGFMNDNLRTTVAYIPGNVPTGNLIPTSDPYRSAPYNTWFTHVNNTTTETATATAFNDKPIATDNIVDWVFVELRSNITPLNTITQTRAALLQRDGDIVDIDGVSPLYFKNVNPLNYTVAVRHRNHLGMSSNPAVFNQSLDVVTNVTKLNFTNPASSGNFMGTAGSNYFNNGTVNILYAGNVNMNTSLRWNAPSSDKDYLLNSVLGGVSSTTFSNIYSIGDVNLNRGVRWNAPNSDKDYILATPLTGSSSLVKNQLFPN
ncbi:MAG: hypothetical protein LH615_04905 [Ferruginibacter sp.]|nr:hypothetical protein [Ferruginibacter sp.]